MAIIRKPSTTKSGASWSDATIKSVWQKGRAIYLRNSDMFREDDCGTLMEFHQYGNRNSTIGWEIDHINPNGGDELSNLQPLNWKNNASKSDKTNWKCGQ
jgi:hypothetical protein